MPASRLLFIVPSRGRPHNIDAFYNAWVENHAEVSDVLVCVDDDDPALDAYLELDGRDGFRFRVGERLRLGPTLNAAALEHADDYFALGFAGDDHRIRTPGLDAEWLAELERLGTGFVYGNDRLQGAAMPTAVALTSDIVRALGWMSPPGLVHLCIDIAWLRLGEALGRITYLEATVMEHMHPAAGKASLDAGYVECNAERRTAEDTATYFEWVDNQLEADVAKVRAACGLS